MAAAGVSGQVPQLVAAEGNDALVLARGVTEAGPSREALALLRAAPAPTSVSAPAAAAPGGFATPEEAALAFAEADARGDVEAWMRAAVPADALFAMMECPAVGAVVDGKRVERALTADTFRAAQREYITRRAEQGLERHVLGVERVDAPQSLAVGDRWGPCTLRSTLLIVPMKLRLRTRYSADGELREHHNNMRAGLVAGRWYVLDD
jgi:hypothetical protein